MGVDDHDGSIASARKAASEAGVADRVTFEVAGAKHYPGEGYDLVTFFDCLHDMGDPVGALRHVRSTFGRRRDRHAGRAVRRRSRRDNLNPIGRAFYGFSAVICTPGSLAREVALGLGAQAGEGRLREVATEAGFSELRRATETPFAPSTRSTAGVRAARPGASYS